MVLKSFVFRHPIERTHLTKQPGVDQAIKKLKSQIKEKSSTISGLYKYVMYETKTKLPRGIRDILS